MTRTCSSSCSTSTSRRRGACAGEPATARGGRSGIPRRFERRAPLYDVVADARARDADDVVLAAAGVQLELGALARLEELVPGTAPWRSCRSPSSPASTARTPSSRSVDRLAEVHELPTGERAKTVPEVERLWRALRIDRTGTLLALGGGALTDAAGFAAATYTRGVTGYPCPPRSSARWTRPSAARPRSTCPRGRTWSARSTGRTGRSSTRRCSRRCRSGAPERHGRGRQDGTARGRAVLGAARRRARSALRRVQGGRLPPRPVRPRRQRHVLTSATRSRTRSRLLPSTSCRTARRSRSVCSRRYGSPEGRPTPVEEVLRPEPVRVDRERAWEALLRDKKGGCASILLGDEGALRGRAAGG